MSIIVPVTEMRDTNKFSKICRESKEPVFVTKNGYGDFVCMNMELYEETMGKIDVQKKIYEGLNEMKAGKVIDGPSFLKDFMEKYEK